LVGHTIKWDSAVDPETNVTNGAFYMIEHAPIHRSTLRFLERDQFKIRFEWEGICDVFWDEEYNQAIPFTASGWATFTGVAVSGCEVDTEESLRDRLAKYLAVCDFKQGELQHDGVTYNDGVRSLRTIFTPVGAGSKRPYSPVTFAPEWRTEAAVGIAAKMYDSRDFGNMPILADALQDAGCEHADILAHCRGDGPHVRGCWVVDLVLGKT
jgi:hypothetical protein